VKFLSILINSFNFWNYFNTSKPQNIQNQIKSNKFYLFYNFSINSRDISWRFVLSIWLIRLNKTNHKENPKAPNSLKNLINNYQTIVWWIKTLHSIVRFFLNRFLIIKFSHVFLFLTLILFLGGKEEGRRPFIFVPSLLVYRWIIYKLPKLTF